MDSGGEVKGWDFKVWEVATGKETHSTGAQKRGLTSCCAFSSDGKRVALGYTPNVTVRMWQLATGKSLWTYENPTAHWHIRSLDFSPDDRSLICAGPDVNYLTQVPPSAQGGLVLVDAKTGKANSQFDGERTWVSSATFSSDGMNILGGTTDGVKFWDVATGRQLPLGLRP